MTPTDSSKLDNQLLAQRMRSMLKGLQRDKQIAWIEQPIQIGLFILVWKKFDTLGGPQ